MKKSEKVSLKWSKSEKDWVVKYPESKDNKAKILSCSLFDMVRKFEEFMSKDFEGKSTGFTNLRDYITEADLDPDTFTITINSKKIK